MQLNEKYNTTTALERWIEDSGMPLLVSVIIPTYNRADYIGEAMESVYSQSHRPTELIVVDDGSSDSTELQVREWKAKKEDDVFSVRYIRQDNHGAPAARNRGVVESRGEFIQFLDSDDVLGKSKISIQATHMAEDQSLAATFASTYILGTEDQLTNYRNYEMSFDELIELVLTGGCTFFNTVSPLFSRKALNTIGPWDEALKGGQDVDYALRFFCTGLKYRICDEAECYVRPDDGRDKIAAHEKNSAQKIAWLQSKHRILMKSREILPSRFLEKSENRVWLARCLFGNLRMSFELGAKVDYRQVLDICLQLAESNRFRYTVRLFSLSVVLFGRKLGAMTFSGFEMLYSALLRLIRFSSTAV